ncbi:MAG: Uma2 family endonuclease [Aggregatilineales bacterium]
MVDQPILKSDSPEEVQVELPYGEIVAEGVSEADYMKHYAGDFYEYIRGYVIKMSPVHILHDELTRYLAFLLSYFLANKSLGKIVQAPFVQKLTDISRREPDLMVILGDNLSNLKPTYMDGPADICIEIISPESEGRDHGEKLGEYERGGVREYWILDPLREESRFLRLNESGSFIAQHTDADGNYHTPLLPGFVLHVPTLWEDDLPDAVQVVDLVKVMLGG